MPVFKRLKEVNVPRLFAMLTVCVSALVATSGTAVAQTIDPAFEQDILKFMEVIGANRIGDQVSILAARQIVDGARKARPDLPQRAVEIINEVAQAKFSREYQAPNGLRDRMVPIYARSFTPDDIRGLLAFYATDLGRKTLMALPIVAQQSAQLAQQWATELGPEIQSEIQRRLRTEGLAP